MAWGVTKVEEKRKQFILECNQKLISISDLCHAYSISRATAYKWLERFRKEGEAGLCNRSRARKTQAHQTPKEIIDLILELKLKHSSWGAKKLKPTLETRYPDLDWPSLTTFNEILNKNGLVVPRKLRKRLPVRTTPLAHCIQPNDIWCADFKGWFLTANGEKCEPFTLTDGSTRFLLRCLQLHSNNAEHVWAVLEHAFREYGLPLYLRTDNGPPFATTGAGRLSKLSVKLIKAGVLPDWIAPGQPQQNGRHERMHGTLQSEAANPPQINLEKQKTKLEEFQTYYNFVRPHEALGQKTPGSVYCPSERKWRGKLVYPEYEAGTKVGWIRSCGKLSFCGEEIYIARTLAGEPVGLEETGDGLFEVYYGPILLGTIDQLKQFHIPREKRMRNYSKKNS
jgi:putative transposase